MSEKLFLLRKRIVQLAHKAGKNGAHVGGSLSCVDALYVLFSLIKYEKSDIEQRDRFILSKGHAALALYCVLEEKGILTSEDADSFEMNGSPYFAHAKRNIDKGIEFSGGSLSLGFSYGVGVAIACKNKELDNKVYILLGDGECNEGLVWEAAMSASNYNLDNLVVIVDKNGIQSDGFTSDVLFIGSLKNKFEAFGFKTIEINGHSVEEIEVALKTEHNGVPLAIISNTIKGHGVSSMENDRKWHHGVVTDEILKIALYDIDKSMVK